MTDLDLTAIRTRADAATPGPWWRESDNEYVYGMRRDGRPNGEGIVTVSYYGRVSPNSRVDAEFIAHARHDVTALLDLVDLLQPPTLTPDPWLSHMDQGELLVVRVAELMSAHSIDPASAAQSPDNFSSCVCGRWSEGSMEPGWDDHLAEELFDAGFLARRPARPKDQEPAS